jgi:hypothetical protein
MKNSTMKAAVLVDMTVLMNQMECKLALLDALDRDQTADTCMDLCDQVTAMTGSLARFTQAVVRANAVNGVDAEYNNLFGEADLC